MEGEARRLCVCMWFFPLPCLFSLSPFHEYLSTLSPPPRSLVTVVLLPSPSGVVTLSPTVADLAAILQTALRGGGAPLPPSSLLRNASAPTAITFFVSLAAALDGPLVGPFDYVVRLAPVLTLAWRTDAARIYAQLSFTGTPGSWFSVAFGRPTMSGGDAVTVEPAALAPSTVVSQFVLGATDAGRRVADAQVTLMSGSYAATSSTATGAASIVVATATFSRPWAAGTYNGALALSSAPTAATPLTYAWGQGSGTLGMHAMANSGSGSIGLASGAWTPSAPDTTMVRILHIVLSTAGAMAAVAGVVASAGTSHHAAAAVVFALNSRGTGGQQKGGIGAAAAVGSQGAVVAHIFRLARWSDRLHVQLWWHAAAAVLSLAGFAAAVNLVATAGPAATGGTRHFGSTHGQVGLLSTLTLTGLPFAEWASLRALTTRMHAVAAVGVGGANSSGAQAASFSVILPPLHVWMVEALGFAAASLCVAAGFLGLVARAGVPGGGAAPLLQLVAFGCAVALPVLAAGVWRTCQWGSGDRGSTGGPYSSGGGGVPGSIMWRGITHLVGEAGGSGGDDNDGTSFSNIFNGLSPAASDGASVAAAGEYQQQQPHKQQSQLTWRVQMLTAAAAPRSPITSHSSFQIEALSSASVGNEGALADPFCGGGVGGDNDSTVWVSRPSALFVPSIRRVGGTPSAITATAAAAAAAASSQRGQSAASPSSTPPPPYGSSADLDSADVVEAATLDSGQTRSSRLAGGKATSPPGGGEQQERALRPTSVRVPAAPSAASASPKLTGGGGGGGGSIARSSQPSTAPPNTPPMHSTPVIPAARITTRGSFAAVAVASASATAASASGAVGASAPQSRPRPSQPPGPRPNNPLARGHGLSG